MTQRDWQKDMELIMNTSLILGRSNGRTHLQEVYKIADHWLQEAKERGEREQRLKEAIEQMMPDMLPIERVQFKKLFSALYPDTPAPKEKTDWLNEEYCARCGRNKSVEGYEWCSECRPDLKDEEGNKQCVKRY